MVRNNTDLHAIAWPVSRLGEALQLLAHKGKLLSRLIPTPSSPPQSLWRTDSAAFGRWMDVTATQLGLEVEPVKAAYAEIDDFVHGAGPALLQLPDQADGDEPRFLALVKSGRWWISIIGPDLKIHRVRPHIIRDTMCYALEAPILEHTDQFLAQASAPRYRLARARRAIISETLIRNGFSSTPVGNGWLLQLSPGADIWKQARHERLFHLLSAYLAINVIQKMLEISAWFILGRGVLIGHIDWGWLLAWALLLLSASAFRMPVQHVRGTIRQKIMGLKQWLIYNALELDPDTIRHQGTGQFLGSIMASGTMEDRIGNGSVMTIVAIVELLIFVTMLAVGVGGWLHAMLLLGWTIVTILFGWRYLHHGKLWISTYHEMTSDLVERMVGHRTRLAQEDRKQWHVGEDASLTRYLKASERLDRVQVQLTTLIPRGWLVVGLAGIVYPFIFASPSPDKLVISLGGVLLASESIKLLAKNLQTIVEGLLAWQKVESLVKAVAGDGQAVVPLTSQAATTLDDKPQVLTARNLVFRFHDRDRPILHECNLHIRRGDRMLLEGPSGGGKSTLAALLAGLRSPESGLLLLRSLDRQTVGADEWRRRVVVAPQFHDNHVFTETFAFNLLMGRRWPPLPKDLEMAEAICRELGLSDLLDRMPAGLQQPVGESGWRLSHGEQSRLYIARALLQEADLVILDESFGTLDPENLHGAMLCVLDRAPTLLVIAHP